MVRAMELSRLFTIFADSSHCIDTILFGQVCDDCHGGAIMKILNFGIDILTGIIVTACIIGIMITGIQYLTAGGNETTVTKAKRRLLQIVIGMALFVVAYPILSFLLPGGRINTAVSGDCPQQQSSGSSSGGSSSGGSSSGGGSGSGSGGQSSYTPDPDRPRSCGPVAAGTAQRLEEVGAIKEKVYTTRTGRTFVIYQQGDIRWGNKVRNGNYLKDTGCYATTDATIAYSYSNSNYYEPNPQSDSDLANGIASSSINLKKSDGGCTGDTFEKIRCVIDKDGVVKVHVDTVRDNPDNKGNHYFPIVDYRYNNGKYQYYLANTVNYTSSSAHATRKIGWVDEDEISPWIDKNSSGKDDVVYYIPRQSVTCK